MTTGQQLIEQGRQLGRNEGRSEGLTEVRIESRADLLITQLEHCFGKLPPDLVARIKAASIDQLYRWAIRLFDTRVLAEVFAEGT